MNETPQQYTARMFANLKGREPLKVQAATPKKIERLVARASAAKLRQRPAPGNIRHLEWHGQARDPWVWYGWGVTFSERQRWFIYATFGHSAASLDSPVAPAEDERDNILNVTPHCEYTGNGLYEYLPGLSRGTGEPQPTARLEFTTVDLLPGTAKAFEAALASAQSALHGETLWYRMVAGGSAPRYVRLRPRPSLSAVLDGKNEQALPDGVNQVIARMTIEILTLRPTMSLGLSVRK